MPHRSEPPARLVCKTPITMGIRGLTALLKQFASQRQLRGRVVIDGPALAYHILWVARLNASTLLDEPRYSVVGATATQWLDSLQSYGLQVWVLLRIGSFCKFACQEADHY